jgi:hypothetical protein
VDKLLVCFHILGSQSHDPSTEYGGWGCVGPRASLGAAMKRKVISGKIGVIENSCHVLTSSWKLLAWTKQQTRRAMFAFSRKLYSKNSTLGGEGLICYFFKDDILAAKLIHVDETSDK